MRTSKKIPLGYAAGKYALDESLFPPEDSLTNVEFMQAHKHWLTLIKILAEPSIYNGWKSHHNRMCNDPDLLKWAHAWRSHDKQLHLSFMDRPFIIDPDSLTYHHQFKRAHLDSWTSMPTHRSPHPQAPRATPSSNRFAPYDKLDKTMSQPPLRSFQDPKNTLCLKCGMLGHHVNTCRGTSNRPDCPTIVTWKDGRLLNKAGMPICIIFNVKGYCSDSSSGHPYHSCSLCSDSVHGATGCTRN